MDRLLLRGLKHHREKLPEVAAVTVKMIAGNDSIEEIEVVPGRRNFAQYTSDDYVGSKESFDWIVPEQRLLFNRVKKQPEKGWLIKWVREDGKTAVFRVTAGDDARPFDTMDQLGLLYRIHSSLVDIEV